MDLQKESITPVSDKKRIEILDILRGIALLGILLMNIPYFATDYLSVSDLRIRDELSGINYYTWWIVNGFFEGTMRALFSMLFGAGVLLLLSRIEKKQATISGADIHYRRMIWLIIFGMVHAYLLQWPGDILYLYGLVGLFLFPIRHWKPKHLLIASIILGVLLTISGIFMVQGEHQSHNKGIELSSMVESGEELDEKQQTKLDAWEEKQLSGSLDSMRIKADQITEAMRGNWFSSIAVTAKASFKFETTKAYTMLFWDGLLGMLMGMFLFKTGWLLGQYPRRKYLFLMLAVYTPGLVLSYLHLNAIVSSGFDFSNYANYMPVMPYHIRRILMAIGHMSLIMLVWKSGLFGILFTALARVGRMAFSNYIGQTLICTTIFYGFGFGLFGKLERYEWYMVVAGVWIFQIIFSTIWLQYFQYGPLEWVWRRLTYWQKIPIRRVSAIEGPIIVHEGETKD
jgi:uncharacterized protein